MKNIKKVIFILLIILFCSGCESSNIKNLSYSKFKDLRESKETFFFVVIKDGCKFCESFIPKLEEVADENNVTGYKLNISDMNEEEWKEFNNEFKIDGTPTTIFMTEGKEVSLLQRIDGNASKEKIISKLKNNNYIK